MTPEQLSRAVVDALQRLADDGTLSLPDGVPAEVTVERPRQQGHGDYATNAAMQLAKRAGIPPRELAGLVADRLGAAEGVAGVEVAGPGFLNVTVASGAQGRVATDVLAAGSAYGRGDALAATRLNVEFVSANPTGPLHLGHTRWAVVGDAIARVLDAAGAEVTREFYLNDRGTQMEKFAASVEAAALGTASPDDGYHGVYVGDLARVVVAEDPGIVALPPEQRRAAFREAAYTRQLAEHRTQLAQIRTLFDVWFSERSLHEPTDAGGSTAVQHGLAVLRDAGHLYDADGATWMRTRDVGDDKDRVLVRSGGELTYFASDTAYYVSKRERGADRCLYLLGADHHGYVARLRAMAACAGDDPDEHLEVLIGQLVTIMRGGTEVKLSKRSGDIVTLAELVADIGVDALRYSLARYPTDSPLTLDIEEITRASADNPVYYVQYAHARISSILRNAGDLGITPPAEGVAGGAGGAPDVDTGLLSHEKEGELLRALADLPRVVAAAAEFREPHRVARYLESTAAAYHRFYDQCRVLPQGDEEPGPLHYARLALVAATRTVLANGLDLLGVSAPERM